MSLHWFSDSQPHLSHHALATCQGEPAQLYLHELTTICWAHVAFVRESSLGHHFSHVTLHSRDKVLHPVGPPEVRENWHTTTLWVCLVYYRTVNYYGKQITSTIIMYALCELSGHCTSMTLTIQTHTDADPAICLAIQKVPCKCGCFTRT